jgi:hypothetical protein
VCRPFFDPSDLGRCRRHGTRWYALRKGVKRITIPVARGRNSRCRMVGDTWRVTDHPVPTPTPTDPRQHVTDLIDRVHPQLVGLSRWIHANPELAFEERLAAGWVADWLEAAGFEVERSVGGLETAVRGTFGSGPFHVAVIAEYDALPVVGHACGHNVIAAAAVGAGVALAAVAEQVGLRVSVVGTPA